MSSSFQDVTTGGRDSLLLEGLGGDESGERLVVLALAVRLPPVGVLLVDDVQHVALAERDAELAARNVDVVLGVVVEVRAHVHLKFGQTRHDIRGTGTDTTAFQYGWLCFLDATSQSIAGSFRTPLGNIKRWRCGSAGATHQFGSGQLTRVDGVGHQLLIRHDQEGQRPGHVRLQQRNGYRQLITVPKSLQRLSLSWSHWGANGALSTCFCVVNVPCQMNTRIIAKDPAYFTILLQNPITRPDRP